MKIKILIMLLAVCVVCCACTEINETTGITDGASVITSEEDEGAYPVTIHGVKFDAAPASAVSLSPALTEIAAELGYESVLTGRSSYCNYPESVSALTDVGSSANPDIAAIAALKPELLLTQSPIAKKDITALEDVGIKVLIMPSPESIDELKQLYADICTIFQGNDGTANDTAADIFKPVYTILADHGGTVKSFVYILSDGLAVASNRTFAGSLLSYFGENCAGDCESFSVSAKDIIEMNPEYIFLPEGVSADSLPEELSDLDAIAGGRIITIDKLSLELLERPTARISQAADNIAALISANREGNSDSE